MKRAKTFVSLAVCLVLILSMAIPAFAASPRILVSHCPKCITGTIQTTTTRKYEHDESFPCEHDLDGYDLYSVYEVVTTDRCNSCSYERVYNNTVHEFVACRGH